ncbi:hypothetical protein CIRG_06331 [Coccidioides immitis RMSCC 2394]|uniref:Cep57 centrosome microtubule-binding domain-containing protein n=1 Tax=Coccidioides immitis RMSCC 2394 TaxID=404692 RepID=A0A0J6YGA8_COCIT|nr:hypothetical protein CIRG_06331 [Coccidioides immitis RMSCC 2394]
MSPNDHTSTSDVLARSQPSRDSTLSDFDPDNDVLISTQQLANENALKEAEDLDYAIDTSALHRALPHFTDASSSDESEALSIEIGRGGRNIPRTDHTHSSVLSFEDSKLATSPGARREDLPEPQCSRPALRSISNRTVMRNQDNLRKDAQIRHASHVSQKENLDPKELKIRSRRQANSSRRPSRTQRRTLSDMHAKVLESYEGSYLSDERPPTLDGQSKNTRFGSKKGQKHVESIAHAVNNAAGKPYPGIGQNVADFTEENNTDMTGTNDALHETANHESFILPDMPDMSELVSGIYHEGMPAGTRQGRSRTTRFASPPAVTISAASQEHVAFDGVPIPEDEKAIFASLKLLQNKVSSLEKENLLVENRLEELQQENQVLRAERSSRKKREEGKLHMYRRTEDESGRGAATLAVERNRLETANMALQNRLDIANHKIAGHDGNMRRVMKERDTVMNKLGVAYLSCQELRSQNESLRRDNEELRSQLLLLTSMPNVDESNPDALSKAKAHKEETTSRSGSRRRRNSELLDLEFLDEGDLGVEEGPEDPCNGHRKHHRCCHTHDQTLESTQDDALRSKQRQNHYEDLFSLDLSKRCRSKSRERRRGSRSQTGKEKKEPNTSKQRVKRAVMENDSDLSDAEITVESKYPRTDGRNTQDLTFLSFIDRHEIALLRKTLEEERIARKQRRAKETTQVPLKGAARAHFDPLQLDNLTTGSNVQESRIEPQAGREPATNAKLKISEPDTAQARDEMAAPETAQSTRSMPGRRRSQSKAGDMTSAIILPDITLHGVTSKYEAIKVSAAAQRVLDEVASHEKENCFVCHESQKHNPAQESVNLPPIKVPRPIPVSERRPGPSACGNEPTLRPSQKPSIALASVLKALEDELAHLKMQLTVFQTTYAKHDPSLNKRQRKAMCPKIAILMTEIEKKSDQIYSLYDVLEGQKKHGEEMTEEEVEVTLHSLGIAAPVSRQPNLTERLGQDFQEGKHNTAHEAKLSDSDDEELPWEGFDDTIESTSKAFSAKKPSGY